MNYVALLFAGAFQCNCIPHLCAGLQGTPFPSPFAKPCGVGDSSPMVNFLWGALNLAIAVVLSSCRPATVGLNGECAAFAVGFLIIGVQLSWHFGRVRAKR
jgi:hypothetical protein